MALPLGFVPPCLPTKAPQPPTGDAWLHEIKHDGFRVVARKDGDRVRLYSRPGNDLTYRFALIVEALARLRSRSCIIDGEAVSCGDDGHAELRPHPLPPSRRQRLSVRPNRFGRITRFSCDGGVRHVDAERKAGQSAREHDQTRR